MDFTNQKVFLIILKTLEFNKYLVQKKFSILRLYLIKKQKNKQLNTFTLMIKFNK
jgi:hypothetical protein